MKTCIIYHNQDLDGWMSAAIVKHWYMSDKSNFKIGERKLDGFLDVNSIEFIGYNYGQPIPDLSEYDKIIMCDISFPKKEMINLYNKFGNRFTWLDHHVSAINDVASIYVENEHKSLINLIDGLRGVEYSACELTWIYFSKSGVEDMPEIVRLLGRYDCFGHKGTDEEQKVLEFQYGARSCISNYEEAYHFLQLSLNNKLTTDRDIWLSGVSIYNYLCTEAKQTYKNGFSVKFMIPHPEYIGEGQYKLLRFICINKERFNPINFGIDYHKDGYDGVASFWFDSSKYNFSVYSDTVDCSIIAKQYGGGGHKGAAGFILNKEQFNNLINNNK